MRTIGDEVMEHAKKTKHGASTSVGIIFLELPDESRYNAAGNIYLGALSIINRLTEEIEELKKQEMVDNDP